MRRALLLLLGLLLGCASADAQTGTLRAKQVIVTDGQGSVLQPPRMTVAQRDASSHNLGEIIYCTDCSPAGEYVNGASGWSLTNLTLPLSVPNGGTGAATYPANQLLYGNGTSPVLSSANPPLLSTGSTVTRGIADRFAETIDVQDYASFNAAVTAIGGAIQTLAITNVQVVASNVSVPANVTLFFTGAGQLSINTGVTVTLNGPIRAPRQRIFVYNGTGVVSIGHNQREQAVVYPEWWGAINDGVTDSNASATGFLQSAINAFTGAGVLDFNEGAYNFSTGLTVSRELEIRGVSRLGTGLFYTGAGGTVVLCNLSADSFYMHDISVDNTNATPAAVGIDLNCERATLARMEISPTKGFTTAVIRSGNAGAVFQTVLDNVAVFSKSIGQANAIGYLAVAGNGAVVRDSHFNGNVVGVRAGGAGTVDNLNIRGSIFELFDGTTGPGTPTSIGVDIVNAQGFSIYGNKFESNAVSTLLPVQLGGTCDGGMIVGNFFAGDSTTATGIAASSATCRGIVIEANTFQGYTGQGVNLTNGPLLDIRTNFLISTSITAKSDRDFPGHQIGAPIYVLQPGLGFDGFAVNYNPVFNKAASGAHTNIATMWQIGRAHV